MNNMPTDMHNAMTLSACHDGWPLFLLQTYNRQVNVEIIHELATYDETNAVN